MGKQTPGDAGRGGCRVEMGKVGAGWGAGEGDIEELGLGRGKEFCLLL